MLIKFTSLSSSVDTSVLSGNGKVLFNRSRHSICQNFKAFIQQNIMRVANLIISIYYIIALIELRCRFNRHQRGICVMVIDICIFESEPNKFQYYTYSSELFSLTNTYITNE